MSSVVRVPPQHVKQLGEKVENTVVKLSSTYGSKDKHKTGCRECGGTNVPQGSGIFCSLPCLLDYWKKFEDHFNFRISKDESRLCGYPGCPDKCYVANDGKVLGFCGRTHVHEYKQLFEPTKSPGKEEGDRENYCGFRLREKTPPTGPILFYSLEDPYYEFTNFYYAPIKIDGKTWPTTEHYFQAQKFVGTPHVEAIRKLFRPREAFEYARNPSVSRWQRGDWEDVKIDVMKKALMAKFSQHDDLRRKLVETGKRELIEHSPYDSFWGDGEDGKGQNKLGELLMKIRTIVVTDSSS